MHRKKPIVAVVENDAGMLRALERLLRASGYASEVFNSAETFLDRATGTEVGCLILDIDLDGISGIELQRKLVTEGNAPPIIFITGQIDEANKARAIAMGCTAFLKKPFESQALIAALEKTSVSQT